MSISQKLRTYAIKIYKMVGEILSRRPIVKVLNLKT